ncbi:hypothetical protein PN36_35075, partial [Candidatus Thiomargarita nelsonii]
GKVSDTAHIDQLILSFRGLFQDPAFYAKAINAFVLRYNEKPKDGGGRMVEIEGLKLSEGSLASAYYSHNEKPEFRDALSEKARWVFEPAWQTLAKAINAFVLEYEKNPTPKQGGDRTIKVEGYEFSEKQLANAYRNHRKKSEFIKKLSEEARWGFEPFWKKSAQAINAFVKRYGEKPKQNSKRTIEIEGYEFSEGVLLNAYYSHNEKREFKDALSEEAKAAFTFKGESFWKKSAQAINAFVKRYGRRPQQRGKETIEIESYKFSEPSLANAYRHYYKDKEKPEFRKNLSAEAKEAFKAKPAWQTLAKAINAFVLRYNENPKPKQRGDRTIEIEGYEFKFSEGSLADAYRRYKEEREFKDALSAEAKEAFKAKPAWQTLAKAINAFVLKHEGKKPKQNSKRTIEIEGSEFSENQLASAYQSYKENPEFRKKLSAKARWAFKPFWKKSAQAINAFVLQYNRRPKRTGKETIEIEGSEFSELSLENSYQRNNEKPEFRKKLSEEAKKLFRSRSRGKISCKALTQ